MSERTAPGSFAGVGAWLALARLSNLPTVWSNALVGLYAGDAARRAIGMAPLIDGYALLSMLFGQSFGLLVSLSLIYIAGMMLNDVFDLRWDRAHRPERPLPSGKIGVATASIVSILLLTLSCAMLLGYWRWSVFLFGLGLVTAIVLYNWLHKRWQGAAVLMGVCRALVYLTVGAALLLEWRVWWWYVGPAALITGVYTMLVTFLAQRETDTSLGARQWLVLVLIPLPTLMLAFVFPQSLAWYWIIAVGGAVVLWLGYAGMQAMREPPRMHSAVPAWLAGIALLDAWYLVLLDRPLAAAVAGGCFVLTLAAQRWIAAT